MIASTTPFAGRIAAVLAVAMHMVPVAANAQGPTCATVEPEANTRVEAVRWFFSRPTIDSTRWKQNGFPFATDTAVQLVTSDSVCALAVQAYNATSGRVNTASALTQAFVIRAGATGYVVAAPDTPERRARTEWRVYYFYDTSWVYKTNASR